MCVRHVPSVAGVTVAASFRRDIALCRPIAPACGASHIADLVRAPGEGRESSREIRRPEASANLCFISHTVVQTGQTHDAAQGATATLRARAGMRYLRSLDNLRVADVAD